MAGLGDEICTHARKSRTIIANRHIRIQASIISTRLTSLKGPGSHRSLCFRDSRQRRISLFSIFKSDDRSELSWHSFSGRARFGHRLNRTFTSRIRPAAQSQDRPEYPRCFRGQRTYGSNRQRFHVQRAPSRNRAACVMLCRVLHQGFGIAQADAALRQFECVHQRAAAFDTVFQFE